MRGLYTLALLVLALVVVVSAQRRHRDPLTEAETDQMREAAQEPEKRIKLVVKFAKARLQAIEQLRGDPKVADGRGKQIHDLLEDFTILVDEVGDNVDMYARRKADISKSLEHVLAADSEFQLKLRALKDAAADPKLAQEARVYEFVLQNAMDAVDSSEQDTRALLEQIAKEKQEVKQAEKKRREKE